MKAQTRTRVLALAMAILLVTLVGACSSTSQAETPPASKPSTTTTATDTPPSVSVSGGSGTVKVVYFHMHVRCAACVYVETRVRYNIDTYFKNETASGKLTFEVFDLGDKQNAAIANKYKAVGSQLFINTMKDGVDHIKHIEAVWMPKYLNDQEAFDQLIQKLLKQALKDVS